MILLSRKILFETIDALAIFYFTCLNIYTLTCKDFQEAKSLIKRPLAKHITYGTQYPAALGEACTMYSETQGGIAFVSLAMTAAPFKKQIDSIQL